MGGRRERKKRGERERLGGYGGKSRMQSEVVNAGRKWSDGDSTNQNWKHFSCEATLQITNIPTLFLRRIRSVQWLPKS